ncbi:protein YIPF3-like [Cylas formicarius]|uniref:protein YIPF3-like n=1 Tax=Cylas formicarius TaxID=197179 RepID=UPI002958961C|nr:protein YIPF3-like [Cylas formicarius]
MSNSIIFIGSHDNYRNRPSLKQFYHVNLFAVPPREILFRIFASFVPPLLKKYRKVYVDFLGPILALVLLTCLLLYGHSLKQFNEHGSPIQLVLVFSTLMPILCFVSLKLGRSTIDIYETVSLVGYSLYGHILTLLVSFLFYQEHSNIFFWCLTFFGGSSTLRLVLVCFGTIPVPAMRFLICSTISLANILFLIYLHYAFMHQPTVL